MVGSSGAFPRAVLPCDGTPPEGNPIAGTFVHRLRNETVLVCHPKGEGAWAEPHAESAPIGEDGMIALRDFLEEREKYLGDESHEALIPLRRKDGTLGYWSEGLMRKLKGQIERRSKVKFHLKTFRATFGQMAIDANASLDAVSVSMRHRTTQTTERFYARKTVSKSHAEVKAALKTMVVN